MGGRRDNGKELIFKMFDYERVKEGSSIIYFYSFNLCNFVCDYLNGVIWK